MKKFFSVVALCALMAVSANYASAQKGTTTTTNQTAKLPALKAGECYVTATAAKYHKNANCLANSKDPKVVTIAEAEKMKKGPCGNCFKK